MALQKPVQVNYSCLVFRVCFILGVIILTHEVEGMGMGRQVSYVGCMKRMGTGFLKKRSDTKNDTTMSVNRCVEICWYKRSKVAAIQAERQCYCSWATFGLSIVPEKECKSRCTGDCYQACGGPNALSVYTTGYTREPTFVMEKRAYLPAFIGCYDSRTAGNILCPSNFQPLWTKRLTIPMCIYYCDAVYQTKFSTVAATDKCCCSNSVHGTRNTVLAWCDFHGTPCDGDKKQGCIGTQRKTLQWSTHVRGRLPNFKRWPKKTFTEGKWLKPNIKAGEKYLMADLAEPIQVATGDATLMGLLAKKKARKKIEGETQEESAANDRRPIVGADKRDPAVSETKGSAGVVNVPKKAVSLADTGDAKENDGSSGAIIAVVVVGLMILLAAIGFYLYSQNLKKEQEAENKDSDDDESKTDTEADGDTDDDDDDKKLRRRKKKKKRRKKKSKKKRKGKGDESEATATDEDSGKSLLDETTTDDEAEE